jgi:hypothetical protein
MADSLATGILVVHSGLSAEMRVAARQRSLKESPNNHAQDCPTDAARSRAAGGYSAFTMNFRFTVEKHPYTEKIFPAA